MLLATDLDSIVMSRIVLWKEAQNQSIDGQRAILFVIDNRATKHNKTYYDIIIEPAQFTSISVKGDRMLNKWYKKTDPAYIQICGLVSQFVNGLQGNDITNGATLYWNPDAIDEYKMYTLPDGRSVKFPATWNPSAVKFSCQIGAHIFLREV
jgi:hypothetical protein